MTHAAHSLANEALWEKDRDHAVHPWTNFGPFEEQGSLIFTRGEGCYLWDADGRRYFDAIGGMWCTNIGLGRREMADAIAEQAMRLGYSNFFVDTGNDAAALLAARLAELTPGDLNRVHFTTGGSTAVDTAVRLVSYYHHVRGNPDKTEIVSREASYHGSTYLTISVGKRAGDRIEEFRYKEDGIHHLSSPNLYRRPAGTSEEAFCDMLVAEFEDLIARRGADRIGGFIAEPIQASGGIVIPPKGYLKRMWEVCQRHDILFIADEVVTAFGRLGHWFASKDEFDVVPDMITSAKGLTSGYVPLGGFAISDAVLGRVTGGNAKDSYYSNGFTYSGHPVSCAAALANMDIFEREKLNEHVREITPYFQAKLRTLTDLPLVGDVRGVGLLGAVECVADRQAREPSELDQKLGPRIDRHCNELGLIVRPLVNMCVISPPLVITKPQIDDLVAILRKGIEATQKDLRAEGLWNG